MFVPGKAGFKTNQRRRSKSPGQFIYSHEFTFSEKPVSELNLANCLNLSKKYFPVWPYVFFGKPA